MTFGKTMHNGARYLIFFQYIGKKYSGAVKAPSGSKGVQDHLEEAIGKLKPINTVSLSVSSRTDTGVNALSNSAHFDLQRRKDKPPFDAETLVQALNFNLSAEQIRITRAHRVPDDFHARFRAQSRTYVYRVALGISHNSKLPLTESDLCWSLPDKKLDVGAMREATAMLVGTQDFSSFRAVSTDLHIISPLKTLNAATVEPGSSFVSAHFHREIPFWELTFTARSFLYKQVRRMTGALVAVGRGQLSVPQLQEILEARDSLSYPQGIVAPARGLFLTRVDYKEADLQFSQQTSGEQFPSNGNSED